MGVYNLLGLSAVGIIYTGVCLYRGVGPTYLLNNHYLDKSNNKVSDSVVFEKRKERRLKKERKDKEKEERKLEKEERKLEKEKAQQKRLKLEKKIKRRQSKLKTNLDLKDIDISNMSYRELEEFNKIIKKNY